MPLGSNQQSIGKEIDISKSGRKKSVSKFRIPIQSPSIAKIRAVIQHKNTNCSNKGSLGISHAGSPSIKTSNNDLSDGSNKLSVDGSNITNNSSSSVPSEALINIANLKDVCIGLQHEQDHLRRSNRLIKDEITSLNDIQNN